MSVGSFFHFTNRAMIGYEQASSGVFITTGFVFFFTTNISALFHLNFKVN